MGLAHRIIPVLLARGRQLVKGKAFNSWRSVGVVQQAVEVYQQRGVDELIILDIAATKQGRGPDLKLIEELTKNCFMPLAVGGGVRSVQDVRDLLSAGADKVIIKSAGWQTIKKASEKVGSQGIVAVLDVNGPCEWSLDCGRPKHPVGSDAIWLEKCGAGEIFLTRMENEGAMEGYDLDLVRAVSSSVSIPCIAHGGCGIPQHMLEAIKAGASAVAAGSLFQFTDITPQDCARYLDKKGIPVRLS